MSKKKILIVDDSIIARMSLMKILSERDYEIFEANSGVEAMKIIDEKSPDLIMTDQLMPGMSGLTLLQLIRAKGINTPVIVVSANQQDITKQKFIDLGVVGIIRKNPDKNDLFMLIDKAFGE